ncbi:MAG: GAF domain-containing protein [Chloroflexi bacterium]|nr:GAF domain-containing protein [Chloroflexota bacterium]
MMESSSSKTQLINPEEATRQFYKNWRERFAIPLLLGVLVFGGVALIPTLSASGSIFINLIFIAIFVLTGIVTVIRFSYLVRMSVIMLGVYVIGMSELITHGILGDSLFFFLGLIIFAAMLLSPRVGIAALVVDILTFILIGWLILSGQIVPLNPDAPPALIEDWISASIAVVMLGSVIILGFQRLEQEFFQAQKQVTTTLNTLESERNNLEDMVLDRTRQLDKVNQIGRAVTAILDPDEMLKRAAHLIEVEFECYYIAFFLIDITGQWAELKEATGEAGRVLRENRHRLDLSGKSAISAAIRTKQAHIVQDDANESFRSDNPLLPYTRSQIALPLIVGENVLGALEMHSTKANAFSRQGVGTFQNMANEIAIALENSHLFREAQQSLTEMRATQRQYLHGAWSSLTADQNLEYAIGDNDPTGTQEIEIPLVLRDQSIGQIHLENSTEWTPEQRNLIESITTQATLALENARLVEESQSVALRERLANELIAKIWASTNMESILQTTVRELGRTLEAAEVVIEVSMDEDHE